MNAKRNTAIALAVTALALAVVGTVALAGNVVRDGDGYFSSPKETFTSGGSAIAVKSVDVSDAAQWAFGRAGLDSIRVEAKVDRPLFVGVARAADVDRYLRDTAHEDVSELSYRPFSVRYDHAPGGAPAGAPADERFWVASASGTAGLVLDWKPRPGTWRAVLMNADGSRGVTATVRFGARTQLLRWVGAGLVGAAAIAAVAAGALYRRGR